MKKVLLKVDKITKQYKNFRLNNVSFEIEEGTIVGFVGENGAGKTTTMSAIMNLIHLDEGKVLYCEKDITEIRPIKEIAYLEADRQLYPYVTMNDYVYIIKKIFSETWSQEKYEKYTRKFNLGNNKKIKDLSTGMRAKFFLAIELAKQPRLLLLDEPTSGLDPIARNEFLGIVRELSSEDETTILFSSHITTDVESIADKVIFIRNGNVILVLDKEAMKNDARSIDEILIEMTGGTKIG